MWKDFFYYTKSERIAVVILVLLILVFVAGTIFFPYWKGNNVENTPVSSLEEEQFLASVKEKEKNRMAKYRQQRKQVERQKRFVKLPEKQPKANGIDSAASNAFVPSISKQEKFAPGVQVDANTADTTTLKKIPGIGRVIARSIVRYRERLGGFASLEQLKEVRYFKPELLSWFVLTSTSIRTLPVNKASLSLLCKHPYLSYAQAKVIFRHRDREGPIKNLSQLSLYEEFTEKDLVRLSPYLSFE